MSNPQRAAPPQTQAFLPSAMATLGFTAIAPAGPTLVHPIVAGKWDGMTVNPLPSLKKLHKRGQYSIKT